MRIEETTGWLFCSALVFAKGDAKTSPLAMDDPTCYRMQDPE